MHPEQANRAPAPIAGGRGSSRRFAAMLALCLVGVAAAVELTVVHVRVHLDPAYHSFCALSDTVSCDVVAQSRYSVFLGVPVSVWGLLGYLGMGGFALAGLRGRSRAAAAGALVLLGAAAVAASAVLAGVSLARIASLCILCFASYGINFGLLILALVEARRHGVAASVRAAAALAAGHRRRTALVALGGLAVVTLLVTLYPPYWVRPARAEHAALPTGVDADGHHWIGAREPRLTIVEFSDYQCPHCRRAHEELRAVLAANPGRLRLVHRHFPLDHHCNPRVLAPFHRHACAYAAMADCAGAQGRFWAANDYLFAHGAGPALIQPGALVQAVGLDPARFQQCLNGPQPGRDADIQEGLRLGLRGTPAFVVDGRVYAGRVPAEVLRPYLLRGGRSRPPSSGEARRAGGWPATAGQTPLPRAAPRERNPDAAP